MSLLKKKLFLNIIILIFIGIILGTVSTYFGSQLSINFIALLVSFFPVLSFIVLSAFKNNGMIQFSNPFLLYSGFYFVFFGVGGVLYDGVYRDNISIGGVATIVGVSGYLMGYLLSVLISRKNQKQVKNLNNNNCFKINSSIQFENILFTIGIVGYILYILQIGQIPLLMDNLEQARVDASQKGGALFRILTNFLIFSSTIGFLNICFSKIVNKKIIKPSLIKYLISIILLVSLGNRAPVFSLVFSSFLIFIFVRNKGKINLLKLMIISVISLILVIAFVGGFGAYRVMNTASFYSYPEFSHFIYEKNYVGLSLYVFSHYLAVGFENFMRVLEVVPNYINYKLGISYIEPLLTALPGTQYTLDMQIKLALNQTYLGGGTVPSVLGEAFANFGTLGWFLVPFLSMFFLRYIYLIYLKNINNMFHILIYAYLLNHFSNSLLSGLASSSILPYITIFIYLSYGYFISNKRLNWKGISYESKVFSNDFSS